MKRVTLCVIAAFCLSVPRLTAAAGAEARAPRTSILFFGGGPHHPYRQAFEILSQYLADFAVYDCTYTEDPSALGPVSLPAHDVLVVYGIQFDREKETPEPVQEGIAHFLESGRGLVVVHSGAASFSTWPGYADLIGAYWRWGKSTHDPYRAMTVQVVAPQHLVTRGLVDFKIIDELYYNLEPREGNTLLLTASHEIQGATREEPIAWTRRAGPGRVFVNLLGHDRQPWENVSFLTVMRRGIDWAAGRLED